VVEERPYPPVPAAPSSSGHHCSRWSVCAACRVLPVEAQKRKPPLVDSSYFRRSSRRQTSRISSNCDLLALSHLVRCTRRQRYTTGNADGTRYTTGNADGTRYTTGNADGTRYTTGNADGTRYTTGNADGTRYTAGNADGTRYTAGNADGTRYTTGNADGTRRRCLALVIGGVVRRHDM
jgi:hypothetical protein